MNIKTVEANGRKFQYFQVVIDGKDIFTLDLWKYVDGIGYHWVFTRSFYSEDDLLKCVKVSR